MAVRVVVLGMHRSGTSAATRVVNLLGVPLGDDVDRMPPTPTNPAGHWESVSLTALNDQVLHALGGSWLAPPPVDNEVWKTPALTALQREALARFHLVHPTESWVWKDPRNCLTLPFWRPLLAEHGATLLVVRDPREVAASLSAREGCSRVSGLALWERYVRAALVNAEGFPTFVLSYAELLDDPLRSARRLDEFLGWAGLARAEEPPLEAIRAFVDPTLHRTRAEDGDELSAAQRELARQLDTITGPHERFAGVPLPPETPFTESIIGDLRWLEARARNAEALAEARGIELACAGPYARELESRVKQYQLENAELHALAQGQAETLGLRVAEVEALGRALAERSALAARHLIENRQRWKELVRLGQQTEDLGKRYQELCTRQAALARSEEEVRRERDDLARLNTHLVREREALRTWARELEQMANLRIGQRLAIAARSILARSLPHGSRGRTPGAPRKAR